MPPKHWRERPTKADNGSGEASQRLRQWRGALRRAKGAGGQSKVACAMEPINKKKGRITAASFVKRQPKLDYQSAFLHEPGRYFAGMGLVAAGPQRHS